MKMSDLMAQYGDDKLQLQNLDQSIVSMDMNKGVTKISFGTDQPIDLNGTVKLGLVIWFDRARVAEIISAEKASENGKAS